MRCSFAACGFRLLEFHLTRESCVFIAVRYYNRRVDIRISVIVGSFISDGISSYRLTH